MATRITPIEKPTLLISGESPDRQELRMFVMAMLKAVDAAQKKRDKQRASLGLPPVKEPAPPEGDPDDPNYGLQPFQPGFDDMMHSMYEDQLERRGKTIDPGTGRTPKEGYRVSTRVGESATYSLALPKKSIREIFSDFYARNNALLRKRHTCIRSYADDKGSGHLEVAVIMDSHAEAQALCKANGLNTYWGFKEKYSFRAEGQDSVET